MQTAILSGSSSGNLSLLIELAKKLGIKASILSEEEIEDIGLARAMKQARTNEFIDTDKFIKQLKKK